MGASALLVCEPGGLVKNSGGQSQTGARKVVIVVEDEPAIGELIAEAISDEPGYSAIHVAGPAAALEATKHVMPDVMVVDVRLPGMSGFEDRKSTRLNSSHQIISYAVFCLKK